MSFKKPVEEYFDYASEHGLSHIEIDLIKEHSFIETFTEERITNLRSLSKKFGISLSLHTPTTNNPSDKISLIRDANIAYLKKCISVAHELHVTHITTHSGYCIGFAHWKKSALERLVTNFKDIIQECERLKVNIALENVNPMPKDSEFYTLGDNIQELEYIFSQTESPYMKMCLDLGHANTNEGPVTYIQNFSDKIINVHFHDNMGKLDDHLNVGMGTIPWQKVTDAFKKIKFNGPFVSECFKAKPHEAKEDLLKYF
jgi:sugar phosphate isomerase/epimerase